MFAECHAHVMMDGVNFKQAAARHSGGVDRLWVQDVLARYQQIGVDYLRDGGDALGVSSYARRIAADYGIDYVTPGFAIHKEGCYGAIVGRAYVSRGDYRQRLRELRAGGGDFVKLMLNGLVDYRAPRQIDGPALPESEIRWLVALAHDAGWRAMAHVNGAATVQAALKAGVDSIEHGFFSDQTTIDLLVASGAVWVPTLAAAAAFLYRPGFDRKTAGQILREQQKTVAAAARAGALIAAGSDAGAIGVPHPRGILMERQLLNVAGVPDAVIERGNAAVQKLFRPA